MDVSKEFDYLFLDLAHKITYVEENFLRDIHFTPKRMGCVSEDIKKSIVSYMKPTIPEFYIHEFVISEISRS
jgi:hypothetical protein